MMATLRCDHPDIEAFIEAKREPGRLRMFNLSVLVSDAFMVAVKEDAPWQLVFGGTHYKTVRARETDGPRPSPDARGDDGTVRDTDFREQDTPDVRSEVDARRSIVPTHTRARVEYPGC
jgi:ribonucleotide reductase alpha subunit